MHSNNDIIRSHMSTTVTADKAPKKINHRYLRDKDREMVRGVFRFNECPGGSLSFVFKKYKEDPVERYDFVDGEVYTIPLGVALHLNKNMWYPIYDYNKTEGTQGAAPVGAMPVGGSFIQKITQKVRRAGFQSLEFMDIEDIDSVGKSIITVENV